MRSMQEEIQHMLEEGKSRRLIAAELGIDPSTVIRYARRLGFADGSDRPSLIDWKRVQAYYDEGHTIDECRERFAFSYGSWDKATVRGDIVTRSRDRGQLSLATRDKVEQLLAEGQRVLTSPVLGSFWVLSRHLG